MAFQRLNKVAKFCTLCCLLAPMIAFGQTQGYKYTKSATNTDITLQATSGTSAWRYIAGNPQCKLGSLAQGYDLSAWCLGINDNEVYKFNPQTKQWDPHPEMGTVAVSLLVYGPLSGSDVYSLQIGPCPIINGIQFYQLFRWDDGAQHWTAPNTTACATNYTFGVDRFMGAAGWDGNTNQRALFYSNDSGVTWTLWSDGWKYVNMADTNYGCAISSTGAIYQVGLNNSAITELSIPSGTAAGCVATKGDPVFLAWNTAGTVYLLKQDGSAWQTVAGLTANQVVAVDKGDVLAMDLTGKPYHWNVYAPTITATTTGTFDNFPMGGLNPPPQHTSHLRIKYPHGINAGLPAHVQQIPYNGSMNNSFTDIAPLCDPYYGSGSGDPECQPNVDVNYAECSVAGPLSVQPDNSSTQFGVSIDNVEWTSFSSSTAPKMDGNGTTGDWIGYVRSHQQDACELTGGTPTCPVPPSYNITDRIWFYWFDDPTGSVEETVGYNYVLDQMSIDIDGGFSPWLVIQPYVIENGATVCLGSRPAIAYHGDYFIMPPCQ